MARMSKLPLAALFFLSFICKTYAAADRDWPVYLGDKAATHFSTLDQINKETVSRLEVAWTWDGGEADPHNRSQIQCNPLVIDGVLYGTSASMKLFALDAATGKELWKFDPVGDYKSIGNKGLNRGLVYWTDGKDDRRILFSAGRFLHALDAGSGKLIPAFGDKGRVNLKKGLGRDVERLYYVSNTPGVVFENLLIIGGRVNEALPAAPGHIRAYDIRTGEQVWRFNTIPHPGEIGYDTWPEDAYKTIGGANVWTGMAVDEENGIVFCPTGSASADFYGGNRKGKNLFANCLIALDAKTGKRLWHFQIVHHDLWDRDLPSSPVLFDLNRNGETIPAVAQTTKSGHVFVFNRLTGESLFPIEERPYPSSALEGEEAWPTQPLPTKPAPFSRQHFTSDEITNISPESYREVLDRFVRLQPHVPFAPPSEQGTIIFPGFDGGAEWGGAAVTPEGILYVNANEMPWVLTMINVHAGSTNGERLYLLNCATCHGQNREGSENQGQIIPPITRDGLSERRVRPTVALRKIKSGIGNMPSFAHLSERDINDLIRFLYQEEAESDSGNASGQISRTDYTHTGYHKWRDSKGYPAVKPPWGTLNALDLNTGEYLWQTTLGEFPELIEQGLPPTGAENYGGPVVTAGGLLFIAASMDEHMRVFDRDSGQELWRAKLPAAGYATPSTYMVDGKQYVVIACGGGKMGTKSADAYVAFALAD